MQKRRAKIARAEEKIFLKMVCMRESSLCFSRAFATKFLC